MARLLLALALILQLAPFVASGAVITVPNDVETIQSAIDSAADGDVVVVLPGEYRENIDFSGKKITVVAPAGPLLTTIDGGGQGPCVKFTSQEDFSSILANFKLTGGHTDNSDGGAILVEGATPMIIFNEITGNSADGNGGAIAVKGLGAPIIYRNLITNNSASSRGGAMYVSASAPQVVNNTIVGNASDGEGGAIYATVGIGSQVVNNIITGNSDGRGAALTAGLFTVVSARYNDVWDNGGEDYSNIEAGDGAISEDPLFQAPEQNLYLLTAESPCIDVGDPNLPADPDGSIADMGCFPYLHLPALELLVAEPATLDFGTVGVGSDTSLALTLRNPNATTITGIIFITPGSPFITADSMVIVEGDAEAMVDISFTPQGEADFGDTLRIIAAAGLNIGDTLQIPYPIGMTSVSLSGSGVPNSAPSGFAPTSDFRLCTACPNPFNGAVSVSVRATPTAALTAGVWDMGGRRVDRLSSAMSGDGIIRFLWRPRNLAAGTYVIQIGDSRQVTPLTIQYLR